MVREALTPDGQAFRNLLLFCRALNTLGFQISAQEEEVALQSALLVGFSDPLTLRSALAAALVKSREQMPLFEAAFRQFLLSLRGIKDARLAQNTLTANVARFRQEKHRHPQLFFSSPHGDTSDCAAGEPLSRQVGASVFVADQRKTYVALTTWEREEMARFQQRLAFPKRRSRRVRITRRGKRMELAESIRRSRTASELTELFYSSRKSREKPFILLLDLSGSMAPYTRTLLRFAHVLASCSKHVEVFAFSVVLTRLTRALTLSARDRALSDAYLLAKDAEGGTRLTESLTDFVRGEGKSLLQRDALVWLATDGLFTGSEDAFSNAVQALARRAHPLVWIYPGIIPQSTSDAPRGIAHLRRSAHIAHSAQTFDELADAYLSDLCGD